MDKWRIHKMKIIFKFKYNLKMNEITNFPKEINALISTYLENREGDYFRDQIGDFIIKEIRDGQTYANGVLHSFNDMPAIIRLDGSQFWYKDGKLHRDNDMPAIIYSDAFIKGGEQFWYQNGKIHRNNDMPAVISNGSQRWYQNGKKHRDNDMPAIIWTHGMNDAYGTQEWYQNGKLHN
jgi:antitoxin component YwqK of YwqJK toxin-antitoxin module